jgi:hypothetical protein
MTAKTAVKLLSACDIRTHEAIGLEIQLRGGSREHQSDTRKQDNSLQIARAWVAEKRGETPEQQRRGWNADRDAHPGGIHRNPNWVRTKPAPNPNIDARARKIAVVMGVIPRECLD